MGRELIRNGSFIGGGNLKLEISRKELEEALQDFVFKKLGDTSYISEVRAVEGNHYVNVDCIEATVKD